jgi:prolipoprotein diacylglyceryltransferase
MSLPKQFESMTWFADVIFIPLVGVMFILCSGLPCLLGELTLNGETVSYADAPLKFVAVILGGMAIGLACIGYGVIRFALNHRRNPQKTLADLPRRRDETTSR